MTFIGLRNSNINDRGNRINEVFKVHAYVFLQDPNPSLLRKSKFAD